MLSSNEFYFKALTVNCQTGIDFLLERQLSRQVEKWQSILKRILHVVLFLGERGLALGGVLSVLETAEMETFLDC